jgi:signal transduction histidine kinase
MAEEQNLKRKPAGAVPFAAEALWAELRRADRMAGVGALAAAVAHEFNNLIGGILGFAQLAQFSDAAEDYKKLTDVIYETSKRVKTIAGALLAIAMRPADQVETVGLGDAVGQVVTLIERRFRKQNIAVTVQTVGVPLARLNLAHFHHALLSVLLRAKDRLEAGAHVTVRSAATPDGRVRVDVEERGPRAGDDRAAAAADPDIGLSLSRAAMEEFGGALEVAASDEALVTTLWLPGDVIVRQ